MTSSTTPDDTIDWPAPLGPSVRDSWALDSSVTFLNHGSFGACSRTVLERQAELRGELESEPVDFLLRKLKPRFAQVREELGAFVGAPGDDLTVMPNATSGVNTALRSLPLKPGDEVIVTNHGYGACVNAVRVICAAAGATVVTVDIPFPLPSCDLTVDLIIGAVTSRTRYAMLDHVSSATGIVFPIKKIVALLNDRGVDTVVDGAHGPGMVSVNLKDIGAAWYAGHLHKWVSAPKGVAFLYVRPDRQAIARPLCVSWAAWPTDDSNHFQELFAWPGTLDPVPFLTVPTALSHMASLMPGGYPAVMERNRQLALATQALLVKVFKLSAPPVPPSMIGTLVTVPLPDAMQPEHGGPPLKSIFGDDVELELRAKGVEVKIYPYNGRRWLRVSTPIYVTRADIEHLVDVLRSEYDI